MATWYVPDETGWKESHGYNQHLRLKVDQTYTASTNKSSLTITLQYNGSADGTWRSIYSGNSPYVKAGGTELSPGPGGYGFIQTSAGVWCGLTDSSYNAATPWSYTVSHNADGSASVAFAVKLLLGGSWSWDNSATLSLTGTPSYKLTISAGTGSSITVKRSGSTLANGATIYRGDTLTVSFAANTAYNLGTHTVNGSTFTSGGTHTVTGAVSVVSTASLKTFALTISQGTGTTVTVKRGSTTLTNGSTLTYCDALTISFAASSGYTLQTHTVNGSTFTSGGSHTVTAAVTVAATAKRMGVVRLDTGSALRRYALYLDTGSAFVPVRLFLDTGTAWREL